MTRKEAIRQTVQLDRLMTLGFTQSEAESLRRISMTLHRWHEHECNGTIQRDGDNGDGRPFWYNTTTGQKYGPVPDRETGARKRLLSILAARNARVSEAPVRPYVQGDPRGAALYLLRPGDVPDGQDASSYYSRGICIW